MKTETVGTNRLQAFLKRNLSPYVVQRQLVSKGFA
jgi:hypothetical protein